MATVESKGSPSSFKGPRDIPAMDNSCEDTRFALWEKGLFSYKKVSYPVRYGWFHEIVTRRFTCQFNLNGEPRFFKLNSNDWPHPAEWLGRTLGNDWLYHATLGYSDTFSLTGEYYYPFLPYPSNNIFPGSPLGLPVVRDGIRMAGNVYSVAASLLGQGLVYGDAERAAMARMARWSPGRLRKRSQELRAILKATVPVLPPDTRHVAYDVIPVMVMEGCLFNCGFCQVKSGADFRVRTRHEIEEQLYRLRDFFGEDLLNYCSLFLGQHDGLAAGVETLCLTVDAAWHILDMKRSPFPRLNIFVFASARSFLSCSPGDFDRLNGLGCQVYINIGLESFDQPTLDYLKKPMGACEARDAFSRMIEVNRGYSNIEISGNVLIGPSLPDSHMDALEETVCDLLPSYYPKGGLYISPVQGETRKRWVIEGLHRLKNLRRIDSFLYLIRRL